MQLMNEVGDLQELLDTHDFYIIDSKVDEVAIIWGWMISAWTEM